MTIEERVSLASLTTFKTGGDAAYVAHVGTIDDLPDALLFAETHALPWRVIGAGSNVLPSDEGYEGLLIRMEDDRIADEATPQGVCMIAHAGVSWDAFVERAVARELWGVENLAGIPGTIGAAPVQNIGAYGRELSDVLAFVDVYDADTGRAHRLTREECGFGYRESRFKHADNLIIVTVGIDLVSLPSPKLEYPDLIACAASSVDLSTPKAIADAVRSIRSRKFPDLTKEGTAGSFFKNPIVSKGTYETLKESYPELPGFPSAYGVKIPLAFILDRILNLKGLRHGSARLFEQQPLVIALDAGGSAQDVEALATDVASRVHDATEISIEREVRTLSAY